MVGRGRRGHLEVGELRQQQLHRLRVGPFVDAVDGLATAPGEKLRDRFVGRDHQLLDEHVRERLRLDPGALHPALAVEGEGCLARLDAQRPAAVAPLAERRGHLLGEPQGLGQLVAGALLAREDGLGVPVGQALAADDAAAVEAGLARREVPVEGDLDGDAAPLDVRAQAAGVVREILRQHGLHTTRDVDGEAALGRIVVERRAGRDVRRHVGDVHPGADAVLVAPQAERVVEVLRLVGIDREREEVAEVDAVGLVVGRRRRHGRVRPAHAQVPEEAFENGLDVARRPQDPVDAGASATEAHHGQVARRHVPGALAVDDDRDPALEIRLAGEELAPARKLTDEQLGGH